MFTPVQGLGIPILVTATFANFSGGGNSELCPNLPSLVLFSAPSMLIPLSGTKKPSAVDKYAVLKGIALDKPAEATTSLGGKTQFVRYSNTVLLFCFISGKRT